MHNLKEIICEKRTYSNIANTHAHPFAQLILPLEGNLSIQTAACRLKIDKEHLFFLPPGCSHTFQAQNNNQFLVLDIPQILLPSVCSQQVNKEIHHTLDQRWQAIRFLLLNETRPHALTDLLRYALRFLTRGATPVSIQYIHDHLDAKITIDRLAALEHFNPSYYCNWFQQQTGLTPNRYIQELRLSKAKDLLLETDFSLLEISQLVGYEHQSSLTRLFQKYEGMSPAQFQKHAGK
ncbi:MAG: AraC family transcriptional regulator [Peptococcaceae bacterium]